MTSCETPAILHSEILYINRYESVSWGNFVAVPAGAPDLRCTHGVHMDHGVHTDHDTDGAPDRVYTVP
jgi:hypothetical protein